MIRALKKSVRRRLPIGLRRWLLRRRPIYPPFGLNWALCRLQFQPALIFDVGANIGDTVNDFLALFPTATVYAFEPGTPAFKEFQKNTAQWGERVKAFQIGLSDSNEQGLLNITSFHGTNSLLSLSKDFSTAYPHISETGDVEQIRLVRLDDFVREHEIAHIDILKIDVEGFERHVLRGGEDTIRNKVDIVFLEIALARQGFDSDEYIELLRLMHGYGFDFIAMHDISYHRSAHYGLRLFQIDGVFCRRGKLLFA